MSALGPPRTLTHEEFQHLLQRAVERDALHAPRLFSLPELVAAGQELGIHPASVEAVYAEYQGQLQRQAYAPPVRQKPLGSVLRLNKDTGILQLVVPALRQQFWPVLFGSGAVTVGAAILISLFELNPLWWLVPPAAALGIYLAHRADAPPGYELRLGPDGSGLLLEIHPRHTNSFPLVAGQVHARLSSIEEVSDGGTTRIPVVALEHATRTHTLLEGYSRPEQAWVVEEIERWLGR